jgi:hypothetical protein
LNAKHVVVLSRTREPSHVSNLGMWFDMNTNITPRKLK